MNEIEELQKELDKKHLIETIFRQIEKELRIKNKAIASSLNPIVFCDLEGNLTYVNEAFLRMWGYFHEGEVLGKSVYGFWEMTGDSAEVRTGLAEKKDWSGELKAKKKDGAYFYAQLSMNIIKDDEGQPVCIMGSFVDISESKKKEREITESKEFLASLINAIPDPVFAKDEKHRWIMLNDEACDRMGLARDELIGKTDRDVFPKEEAAVFWGNDDHVFREGGTLVSEEKITWQDEQKTIATIRTLCVDDVTGEKFIIGTIRDITDKKNSEHILREQFHFLRQFIDNMPIPIFFKDAHGRYLDCNPALEDFLGRKKDQIIGKTVLDILPHDMAVRHDELDRSLLQKGGAQVYEYVAPRGDGTIRDIMYTKAVYTDTSGNVAGLVGGMIDITDRKKAEEELRQGEQRYRSVVDNIGVGVSVISPSMEILSLNAQMRKWFPDIDVSKKPVCYRAFNVPPREDVCSYCPTCLTLKDGKVHEAVTETPAGDKVLNFRIVSTPIIDKDGNIVAAIEMVDDITERKRIEEALRHSEEKFRLIAENTSDYISITTMAGDYVYVSPSHKRLGYAPEELVGKNGMEFMRPEDRERLAPVLGRYASLEEEKKERMRESGIYEKLEFSFIDKKGRWHDIEATANIVKSLSGTGYDVLVISRDVTERKKAEDEIRKSYETTLDIIENAPLGIYLVNSKGDIDYVNPAMLEISADTYEQFTGMNVFRDIPGYVSIGLTAKIRAGLEGEYFEMKCVEYTSTYGKKTTIRNFIGIPLGGGDERKVLMIVEDITEAKKAEWELIRQKDLLDCANKELESKIRELQEAMGHIKRLEGLVPICMNCKKMRVEGVDPASPGAWIPLERYIAEKTDASLTHGLCPECAKKLYGKTFRNRNRG